MRFNSFFDMIYLINLDSRPDRLFNASKECSKVGIEFKRVSAVDGKKAGLKVNPYQENDYMWWNEGAAGLAMTTISIIEDAIKKKYRRILILEDDIEFRNDSNEIFNRNISNIPNDWQMILFGAQHIGNIERLSNEVYRVDFSYCCHCYAINCNVFEYYLWCLKRMEKQIDLITCEDIQPLRKTYAIYPDMAYQKKDMSNIQGVMVDHSVLMRLNKPVFK